MSGQVVGYARVSTVEQNEARQIEALGEVDRLFVEKASGRTISRPQFEALRRYVREGDLVRVKSADRLARSTTDLLRIMEEFESQGVRVEFTDTPALNTASAPGRFMLTILAAVAELELATIRERQAEGIALAKARGVYDRGPMLTEEQVMQAEKAVADRVPKSVIARGLGCSRQTLYTALKREGRYGVYASTS